MSTITDLSPLDVASAKVDELRATVNHWGAEEADARDAAAAAQQQLEDASLEDSAAAYALIESIAAAEGRAAAAASLSASARQRLDAAHTALLVEQAVEARAAATQLWEDYRAHELRRRELLQQLVDFDGVGYVASHHTGSRYRLDAAKMADERVAALEVEAFGESVVLRTEVPSSQSSRRTVWVGMAGPRNDRGDQTLQRSFRVNVDGQRFAEGRLVTNMTGEPVTWIQREFPADAVVVIEGQAVRYVDDPAAGTPAAN
jgi:ATP/maltotriose-dependent transcriptional regulator MalT